MYTSCGPCAMCAAAIEPSGIARVVFALSAAQHARLTPGDETRGQVPHEGPALFDEARIPVEGYGT